MPCLAINTIHIINELEYLPCSDTAELTCISICLVTFYSPGCLDKAIPFHASWLPGLYGSLLPTHSLCLCGLYMLNDVASSRQQTTSQLFFTRLCFLSSSIN